MGATVVTKGKRRSFGGKITGFKNKAERASETKHLKAYLKGKKQYKDGYITLPNGRRVENFQPVKENWK